MASQNRNFKRKLEGVVTKKKMDKTVTVSVVRSLNILSTESSSMNLISTMPMMEIIQLKRVIEFLLLSLDHSLKLRSGN